VKRRSKNRRRQRSGGHLTIRAVRLCRIELLEPRLPLSADASPFAPITWSTQPNGLPILTSFPNAPAMIYLDYLGDQGSSEFDLDNTPGVFTP
jgi:hypothetical protein